MSCHAAYATIFAAMLPLRAVLPMFYVVDALICHAAMLICRRAYTLQEGADADGAADAYDRFSRYADAMRGSTLREKYTWYEARAGKAMMAAYAKRALSAAGAAARCERR